MPATKVLISYARADGLDAAARLRGQLERAGCDVWRDIEEMRGGKDWKDQLREAIEAVEAVVVLLTPAAVASEHVLWECDTAQTLRRRVIGLLILPCNVPDELSHRHYHNLSTEEEYVLGFAALLRDLNELKGTPSGLREAGGSSGSQFDLRGAQITKSQIGCGNTMYNDTAAEKVSLIPRITQLLQAEHQQLRVLLLRELTAMHAGQQEQLEMLLQSARSGSISERELADFMVTIQTFIARLQDGSLSANNELVKISRQLQQVYDSTFSLESQFELTLPILPGIFAYKHMFGGAMDTNLRNLIEQLRQSWERWTG